MIFHLRRLFSGADAAKTKGAPWGAPFAFVNRDSSGAVAAKNHSE
jgi:hypothetical protein